MFDLSCVKSDEDCRRPEASSLPTIDPDRMAGEAATQERRNPERDGLVVSGITSTAPAPSPSPSQRKVALSARSAHRRWMAKTWVPKDDKKSAKAFAKAMRLMSAKNNRRNNSRSR
jgi:hypothetical protein